MKARPTNSPTCLAIWAGLGGGGIDLSGMDEPETKNAESVPDYLAGVIDPEARNGILTSLQDAQAAAERLDRNDPAHRRPRSVSSSCNARLRRRKRRPLRSPFGCLCPLRPLLIRRYLIPDDAPATQGSTSTGVSGFDTTEETAKLAAHCSEQGLVQPNAWSGNWSPTPTMFTLLEAVASVMKHVRKRQVATSSQRPSLTRSAWTLGLPRLG